MSKKSKKRQAAAQGAQSNSPRPPDKTKSQNSAATPLSKTGANSRTNKNIAPLSFFQRLSGVGALRAPVYREVAHAADATKQAALVVGVVALIVGAVNYFFSTQLPGLPDQAGALGKPLARAIVMVIQELALWGAGAFVMAAVAKNLFHGSTNTGEMLRVFGFTRVFQILVVLGVFGSGLAAIVSIAGLVLSIIGSVIGIREATGFTTGKAAIVGVFAITLVVALLGFFVAFALNPFIAGLPLN